jgi:membrane-associated protease RseP (regulator of RpoE activity)
MEFSINLLSIFLFYGLIGYFIFKNRKKIEFHKLYLLYKTKYGIKLLDRFSGSRFWKYWGYLAIPVGFLGMFFILGMLLFKVKDIFLGQAVDQGVQLLLPWTGSGSAGPFMLMPFWTFIICIAVVVLVHEGAHGVISRAHNLKVNATGLGMFTIIPLAFVEPDDKQLDSASAATQLSVFAAGPFANICMGFIVLFISLFVLIPLSSSYVDSTGLEIIDVISDFPAGAAGIVSGDTIVAVNGEETLDTLQFVSVMNTVAPNEQITVLLQDREVSLITTENPMETGSPYIGISFKEHLESKSTSFFGEFFGNALLYLIGLFGWLWVLNIGIGLVNLLPLGPVDGGRMLLTLSHRTIKNETAARTLWLTISLVALLALLINLLSPFLMSLF